MNWESAETGSSALGQRGIARTKGFLAMERRFEKKTHAMRSLLATVCTALLTVGLLGCSASESEGDAANGEAAISNSRKASEQSVFYAGVYEVGVSLPTGNYVLTPDEEGVNNASVAYVGIFPDSSLNVDDVLYFYYFKDDYRITVSDGQFVKVLGASLAKEESGSESTVFYAGSYEVGVSLPAGNYVLTSDEETSDGDMGAYVGVFSDSSLNTDNILYYQYFEDDYRITVSDGQFVKVSSASLSQEKE